MRQVSHRVISGRRHVVVRRPLVGVTPRHHTFDPVADSLLHFIAAVGGGPKFGRDHHVTTTATKLAILPRGVPTCVCAGQPAPFGSATGSLEYIDPVTNTSKGRVGFNNLCKPQPRMDTLAQRNPTCDLRTYAGGQIACHHGWRLLDADQTVPWEDQPLEYHLKFRYWFQEYSPSRHKERAARAQPAPRARDAHRRPSRL